MAKYWLIKVYGIVQGVNFRYNTKERADKLGLRGTVKNLGDGSVEICISGSDESIKNLINWLKSSPNSCKVSKVIVDKLENDKNIYNDFKIVF
ncbi:acylphosphatase [Patescibacteria group bacterium]|nr:acylphosphatase [Patescibacteria group bacterium]MBU0963471.1 acylphosphatase [Patescibacteria group bacterium]